MNNGFKSCGLVTELMSSGRAAFIIGLSLSIFAATPASAYSLKNDTANGCGGDGSLCIVYCDNGSRAGAMNWNGMVWTDGSKWDKNKDVEAKMICAANGGDCT